jgi:hypothetical protein
MTLSQMLADSQPDIVAIDSYLNGLSTLDRRGQVLALSPKEQSKLFSIADGHRKLTTDSMVPKGTPPLTGVAHHGKNSLPVFTGFAKVMCRPSSKHTEDKLWGYNKNPFFVHHVVGPGFYVAYPYNDGEYLVDYTQLPAERAADWPEIVPNTYRLSRFVFYGMKDVLRGVSDHVTIGRAMKDGKWLPNWFVLCRD